MTNHIRIEDERGSYLRGFAYPERKPDEYHEERWEIPRFNPYSGKVGGHGAYEGEAWLNRHGHIQVTGTPWTIETSEDARRIAAVLLAAADRKDELDNPFVPQPGVEY